MDSFSYFDFILILHVMLYSMFCKVVLIRNLSSRLHIVGFQSFVVISNLLLVYVLKPSY
jgi:hypothetical protein